jgi:hypothetical protein
MIRDEFRVCFVSKLSLEDAYNAYFGGLKQHELDQQQLSKGNEVLEITGLPLPHRSHFKLLQIEHGLHEPEV